MSRISRATVAAMTPAGKKSRRPARSGRVAIFIGAILLIALASRLLFLSTLSDTPFFSRHFSDSKIYVDLAHRFLSGEGSGRAWFMSPLYPWILSLVMRLTGDFELWIRVLQVVLGCVTVFLVWRIGTLLFDRWTGLVAALLTAVSIQLVYYDSFILMDSLLTCFTTAGLYFLLMAAIHERPRDWILSGIIFGLAVVSRSSIIAFLPMVWIAWMFRAKDGPINFRGPAIWSVSLLVILLPTAIHNYSAEGIFQPVTSSFGFNLYAGNNEGSAGLYHLPDPVDLYTDPNGHGYTERMTGKELNSAEVSSWWRDKALKWISSHPGDAALLFLRKILLVFHPGDIDQIGLSMEFFEQRYGPIPALPLIAFPLILILAGVGFATGKGKPDWPLSLFVLSYALSTAVFFVSGRLRLPLLPILHVYAAAGGTALVVMMREKATVGRWLSIGLSLGATVLVLLVQPAVDQRFEQEYLKLGQVAFETGDYPEAASMFTQSLEERPTLDGHINLGNAYAAQGKFPDASTAYRQALALDSTSALAWFNYGNMWMQRSDAPRAHACWTRAVRFNPRLAAARRNLGILFMQAGRLADAEAQFVAYLAIERDPEMRAVVQHDLNTIRRMLGSQ